MSTLLLIPVGLAIGLASRAWGYANLATVVLIGLGTLVALAPIALDEIRESQRRSGPQ